MPMRADQEKVVTEWGAKHAAVCPICKHNVFDFHKDFFQLSKLVDGAGQIVQGDPAKFVGFNCQKCGYFFLVDAAVAKVPK